VNFLKSHDIIDYSLLVGVHLKEKPKGVDCMDGDISPRPTDEPKSDSQPSHFFSSSPDGSKGTAENETTNAEINAAIPSIPYVKEVYQVGLIDFLSRYYLAKKTAHLFKSVLWEDQMLSTVPPEFYANRFKEYLPTIFPDFTKGLPPLDGPPLSLPTTPRGNDVLGKPSGRNGLNTSGTSGKKGIPRSLTDNLDTRQTTDLTSGSTL